MICLAVGLIAGVSLGNRAGSKDNGTDVVMGSPSQTPTSTPKATATSKVTAKPNTTPTTDKEKTDVVTQAEDFWSCLEEVDSDEMNDAQAEELKEQMEKFDVFDKIAAIEGFSGSSNNSGTSYGTNGSKPTNTPAKQTPFPDQDELEKALQILKKMDELNVKQKDVFERELLWQYCDKKAENAKCFVQLQKTLKTVLDNDN